jgi:hypothetical protein
LHKERPTLEHTPVFKSDRSNHQFDPLNAGWEAKLLEAPLQVNVILRAEVKISGFAYSNNLIWIPLEIFRSGRIGAKIQRPEEWMSGVAWISPEDDVDGHRRDGLIVVVDHRNREPIEPVIIIVECFTDFDVCFFLGFSGDDFHWFYPPGFSN